MDKSYITYYKIARDVLTTRKGLQEEEVDELMEKSNFEEIEEKTGIEDKINYILQSISKYCYERNILTDHESLEKATFKGYDSNVFKKLADDIYDREQFWGNMDLELAYNALGCIHNGQAQDNVNLFFSEKKEKGEQYKYLPFELMGWEEVKEDLIVVNPMLKLIGIDIDEGELEEYYNRHVYKFLRDNNIQSAEDLSRVITENPDNYMAFYDLAKGNADDFTVDMEPVSVAFSDKEFVEDIIIPEIAQKGIGKEQKFQKLFEGVKTESKDNIMTEDRARRLKESSEVDSKIVSLEKELELLKKRKEELLREAGKYTEVEALIGKKEGNIQDFE